MSHDLAEGDYFLDPNPEVNGEYCVSKGWRAPSDLPGYDPSTWPEDPSSIVEKIRSRTILGTATSVKELGGTLIIGAGYTAEQHRLLMLQFNDGMPVGGTELRIYGDPS